MALDAWAPAAGAGARAAAARSTAALDALRAGEVDAAMVPIENSVEGGVSAPPSTPSPAASPLVVTGEVLVPITFVLAARPGTPLADVRAVGTHSHALGPGPRLDGRAPARRGLRPDAVDGRRGGRAGRRGAVAAGGIPGGGLRTRRRG